ncbi:MAG: hemolysin family protein [Victivallales bacterium]|nr:hemolysin family protein [Victivallales bacterium]
MQVELFSLFYLFFIWALAGWEALLQLSGGRVRRIESGNRALARKAEEWVAHQDDFDVVFRIVCMMLIAVMSIIAADRCNDFPYLAEHRSLAIVICAGVVLVCVTVAEMLVRMINYHFYMMVLRASMPVFQLLRYTLLFPVTLVRKLVPRDWRAHSGEDGNLSGTSAEDEILSLVEKEETPGIPADLEDDEKRMIKGIFDLDDTPVREIMTPRVDLETLPLTATVNEAKAKFCATGHSRIPVYKDTIDEIAGIVYAKDFLNEARCADNVLSAFLHPAVFVPETKNVGDLLEELKRTSNHLAVVIDEYGGLSGIVTLEDIIEEIVGEISDEYDTPEDVEEEPEPQPDGSINFDARYLISDLIENYDVQLPESDVDTLGGYVCGEIGRIPETGETFTLNDNLNVKVLKADRRKILRLNLKIMPSSDS